LVEMVGWRRVVSTARPNSGPPRSKAVQVKVREALREVGSRNAGTPLEIASTPESATAPDENAFMSAKRVTPVINAPLWVNWFSWA